MDQSYPTSEQQRTRHACEPCRRKKTKCTAERPVCSFCQRLNIQCEYLPRERTRSDVSSRKSSKAPRKAGKDRVKLLETQVSNLYDILRTRQGDGESSRNVTIPSNEGSFASEETSAVESTQPWQQTSTLSPDFTLDNPEPPAAVVEHLADVYCTTVHLQPLPLFNPVDLHTAMSRAPQYLRWSFLSLTLTTGRHEFYCGKELIASQLYARAAEDAAMKLVYDGVAKLEVLQSLCLLAFKEVIIDRPSRAWMLIGTASRLEALRMFSVGTTCPKGSDDSFSRCHWSVYILERLFMISLQELPGKEPLEYPESAPLPPRISNDDLGQTHPSLTLSQEDYVRDLGMTAYAITMTTIWGKVGLYLHQISLGKVEVPWLPDSSHANLTKELFEHEAQLPACHLLRHVSFQKRTTAELQEQREYWNPWLLMQICSHAAPAILNHLFLHLFVLRPSGGVNHSRLFLQQTVDLSLLHSGWVFWILQMCEDSGFEINDPMIGCAVAATATIPWFFQFTLDESASKRARNDLSTCERYLSRMAAKWPHIAQKLEAFQSLQRLANRQPRAHGAIDFKSSLLWDLLHPVAGDLSGKKRKNSKSTASVDNDIDSTIRLTTTFMHPLDPNRSQHQSPPSATTATELIDMSSMDFEQFDLEDLTSYLWQNNTYNDQFPANF